MNIILGISSAMKILGVSLVSEEGIQAECSVKDQATEKLVLYVDEVLKRANIPLESISAIAVTVGPGSYGGLRGGLATAKTFSQVLNKPIIGVSTLEAMAYNLIDQEGTIFTVLDACREDNNFALFSVSARKLNRLTDDIILTEGKIIDTLSKVKGIAYLVCTNNGLKSKFLEGNPATSITALDIDDSWPKAVNIAKIGLEKLKKGEISDYLSITPHYSHKPNIREYKWAKESQ